MKLYIDEHSYNLLRLIFTREELEDMKLDKEHFISKDTKTDKIFKIKENVIIIICGPIKDIIDKVIEISYMLDKTEFNLIFIPGETYELIKYITGPGLGNRFKVFSFNMDLFPIDNDLISCDKEGDFKSLYLDKDQTPIMEFVNSFMKLELCYGKIKHKYIKGERAKLFCDLLTQKENETNMKTTDEILGMIVFDRNIDFITPMSSNFTYEGLIDEHYNINKGSIIYEQPDKTGKRIERRLLSLNSNTNEFFSQLRAMNYLDANTYMFDIKKKLITDNVKETQKTTDMSKISKAIEAINEFVSKYRGPIELNRKFISDIINEKALDENMTYALYESKLLSANFDQSIKQYYDDNIAERKDLTKILTLMSLETLTQGGIKDYDTLKRDILNIYGYQNIFLIRDLENIGLLRGWKNEDTFKKLIETGYKQICAKLNLVNTDFDVQKITDCSYIYRGYCPIILRLLERAVEGKWEKLKDVISKLPGDTLYPANENEVIKPPGGKVHTIFVVFVGGVTYTEIEGIRYINIKLKQQYERNKNIGRIQFIIVTNEILNRKKIFNSLGKNFEQSYDMKKYRKDIEKEE